MKVSKTDCATMDKALELEWFEANGRGGYASSTIVGCNTRRYHGLLVAKLERPPGRYVLLSKLDDSVVLGDGEIPLTVHQYPEVVVPADGHHLSEFCLEPVPTFRYVNGTAQVVKEVALVEGRDTVLGRYSVKRAKGDAKLRLRPLLAYRDFHSLTHENINLRVRTYPVPGGFTMSPYDGMPPIFVQTSGPFEVLPSPVWYRNFEYVEEQRRGFDHREDLFSPVLVEIELAKGSSAILSVSTEEVTDDLEELWNEEMERRRRFRRKLRGTALQKSLMWSARQFLSTDGNGHRAVVAGYPWFAEWGRDAMISLPGLTLHNGLGHVYLDVLRTFLAHERDGLVPNFIGETADRNAYNSVDASLWLCWAVQKYLERVRKLQDVNGDIFEGLKRIFRAYRDGTHHGIRMLENGLLTAGSPEKQLTWMDAVVDGRPVTPRWGCAVEICALWHNLVRFVAELGDRLGDPVVAEAGPLGARIASAFNETFWIPEERRLGDVYRDGVLDRSLRPNQIFAVSLPYSPLDREHGLGVLEAVRSQLLTPYGLRTLALTDTGYRGCYEGGPEKRDAAYHNGTTWPWLIGHYGEALLRLSDDKREARLELERCLEKLEEHLHAAGLGTISEVFDGDSPHRPGGCPSQAWSVAEVLRLTKLVEGAR